MLCNSCTKDSAILQFTNINYKLTGFDNINTNPNNTEVIFKYCISCLD